jgi:hypothetical protein
MALGDIWEEIPGAGPRRFVGDSGDCWDAVGDGLAI